MARSPMHYHAYRDDMAATPAMQLGTAVHRAVLDGELPVVYPGAVRRGKAWEQFQADHVNDNIVTEAESHKIMGMCASVQAHPEAVRVLTGERERYIEWTYQGRAVRSTPDVIGDGFVTDLTTTVNADPERFKWDAVRRLYHAQLAFYAEAVRSSGLGEPRQAYIVAVESSAPYAVSVLRLTPDALDIGGRLCHQWMEQVRACEAANHWPGYSDAIVDLDCGGDDVELTFSAETLEAAEIY